MSGKAATDVQQLHVVSERKSDVEECSCVGDCRTERRRIVAALTIAVCELMPAHEITAANVEADANHSNALLLSLVEKFRRFDDGIASELNVERALSCWIADRYAKHHST